MKRISFLVTIYLLTTIANAQNFMGQWNGRLKVQNIELKIVFHINESEGNYSGTMDSPDQGAKGISFSSVSVMQDSLFIDIKAINGKYAGKLISSDSISGVFSQMGMNMPLNMSKKDFKTVITLRPQEPKPPFPYYSEEVKFVNKIDGDTLAGTLTLPSKDGKYPVVVMITGSGAQDRNEEIFGHKPFFVIADYLARNGIGVLRYDDRGTAQSTGDFKTGTSYDFSKDAEAGINYLLTRKDVNKKQIGIIGHSDGGLIAPMIAARNKKVAYIVLLAGPGVPGDELLLSQARAIGEASGMSKEVLNQANEKNKEVYKIMKDCNNQAVLKEKLRKNLGSEIEDESRLTMTINQLTSPWFEYFVKYDPASALEKVKIPVLALNGSKDLQVPAKYNLPAIKAALDSAGNKKYKIVEFPGLNHLFQECNTGLPTEYGTIEQTISPIVLSTIKDWIKSQLK